jgi:hypothetical protein
MWAMIDFFQLSLNMPAVTCVRPLTLSHNEECHLTSFKSQYLNTHDNPSPSRKARQTTFSNESVNSFEKLHNDDYDFGGTVPVTREVSVRKVNYYSYLISWISSKVTLVGGAEVEKPMFLVGLSNGEVLTVELIVSERRGKSAEKAVVHRIRSRRMVSKTAIVQATYFAAGHHAVISTMQTDQVGQLKPYLVLCTVPHLKEVLRTPTLQILEELSEDLAKNFAGNFNMDALASRHINSMVADNINLVLFISLGDFLIKLKFVELPAIDEAIYFNQDAGEEAENSAVGAEDPQLTAESIYFVETQEGKRRKFDTDAGPKKEKSPTKELLTTVRCHSYILQYIPHLVDVYMWLFHLIHVNCSIVH